jgi:hypothetical protein
VGSVIQSDFQACTRPHGHWDKKQRESLRCMDRTPRHGNEQHHQSGVHRENNLTTQHKWNCEGEVSPEADPSQCSPGFQRPVFGHPPSVSAAPAATGLLHPKCVLSWDEAQRTTCETMQRSFSLHKRTIAAALRVDLAGLGSRWCVGRCAHGLRRQQTVPVGKSVTQTRSIQ